MKKTNSSEIAVPNKLGKHLLANLKTINNYRYSGLLIGFFVILLFSAILTPSMFNFNSISSMLRNNSVYAILALGIMVVLITGGIDLSIASTLALSGVITTMLLRSNPGIPSIIWLFVSAGIGALCGALNGFLIGKLNMIPLIVTLGTMYIYRGLAYLVSGGTWYFPHQFPESYKLISQGTFLGIYNITWIAIILFCLMGVFLALTKSGRRIYAIGTSSDSSKVTGINIGNVKLKAYIICGALAGLAGMLYSANYAVCYYGIAEGNEMQAIAICILGGVSITGGRGRIDGVFISLIIMSFISYFISLLPNMSVWQDAIQGAIIIIAVGINIFTGKLTFNRALKERGKRI
jgi:rhamnose transport system permease protein